MNLIEHPVVQSYINSNHFGELLDMKFEISEPGKIRYSMPVHEKHLATPIAAHGGSVCALMDATMGVCALTDVINAGKVVSTIEMKISFVSPAALGDMLEGTAEIIKSGNRLIFVEGLIRNQDGKTIATASGTFNAYPLSKAGFDVDKI